MRWNDFLSSLPVIASGGVGNPDITDVTCDSRRVVPGSLYVSISGFKRHGDEFIEPAIGQGAVAVLSENPQPASAVPWAQVGNTRKTLGTASRSVWGIDGSETLFVGITGTNGKTTIACLFQRLFSEVFGPRLAWMFGTVAYSVGDAMLPAPRTTPESSDIFRIMARAQQLPKAVVMEVSSHALALDRIAGIAFDCAVWTNLTQDHLDFHPSMEEYYQAKKLLFTGYLKKSGRAVINIDDPWGKRLAGELAGREIFTYGASEDSRVRIIEGNSSPSGTEIALQTTAGVVRFASKLAGHFNVYNMTALAAGALSLSIDAAAIARCFETMETVPGRMERVPLTAGFSVFVDYAHTPDALVNVLSAAGKFTQGRLICVFGCGGERDTTKRPLMAAAAARHCDEAIITSDNPRSEDPALIVRDILRGMPLDFPHVTIADRREAIRKALTGARAGDCVIVAGKGHEDYQEIKGTRNHFDDKETVRELFAELEKRHAANK
jgi:UDP-N-acetylmuramoyl-L-alanyl-D-glutamate--2,6-diaminopimelate ligase